MIRYLTAMLAGFYLMIVVGGPAQSAPEAINFVMAPPSRDAALAARLCTSERAREMLMQGPIRTEYTSSMRWLQAYADNASTAWACYIHTSDPKNREASTLLAADTYNELIGQLADQPAFTGRCQAARNASVFADAALRETERSGDPGGLADRIVQSREEQQHESKIVPIICGAHESPPSKPPSITVSATRPNQTTPTAHPSQDVSYPDCSNLRIEPINGGGSGGVMSLMVITGAASRGDVTQTIGARYGDSLMAFKTCVGGGKTIEFDVAEFVTVGNQGRGEADHFRVRQFRWDPQTAHWNELGAIPTVFKAPKFPQCDCPQQHSAWEKALQSAVIGATMGE